MTETSMAAAEDEALWAFVTESNRIEGIRRAPKSAEISAHLTLLEQPELTISNVCAFVSAVQPDAVLREQPGVNVYVGDHVPPSGGPWIRADLGSLLALVSNTGASPYKCHHEYETLHPFTDGNGRSGRAVWLWQMMRQGHDPWAMRRGFLHSWYYQSLAARNVAPPHAPKASAHQSRRGIDE